MPRFTYHKHRPNLWEDLDLSELVNAMSEFLLGSGFGEPADGDNQATQDDLKDAIINALMTSNLLPDEDLQKLFSNEDALNEFLEKVIERLMNEGFIQTAQNGTGSMEDTDGQGEAGGSGAPVKFELSEKGTDFLGYRALRELMGALGRSSFGSHDTQDLSTGVDASGPSKAYEFGDTMNLDVSETLLNTIRRTRSLEFKEGEGLDVGYEDLVVRQTEYRSSCATVVMLDCSHSMILYGEDRFTPAKKVALALSHLLRTQYPGDSLRVVLFHDSAEEIPLSLLGKVKVGPHYTNTREGLRVAQRILARERKDMKQIVMITDGKPTALTLDDGRIYRNPFGLDPKVIGLTLKEVINCRRQNIMINTFMLARDYELMAFVSKVSELTRGKAYFTSPYDLGEAVLMDFLRKKRTVAH
ncbi:MAG TPA: VWA domain-containing protein [Vicinamibacteria bacterium]|nr:VWA domain-containing protein [Vicinamibacteria bacterium]